MQVNTHKLAGYLLTLLVLVFYSCKQTGNESGASADDSMGLNSIEVNSEKLHYVKEGEGDPIIFVHGTISDFRTWASLVDAFSTKHEVVTYSRRYAFPNEQEFDDSFDYSPKIHGEDLEELIGSLGYESVHLVGHSYGAYTALLTAMSSPQKVKSLVLGEPPILPFLRKSSLGDSLHRDLVQNAFEPSKRAFNRGDEAGGVAAFLGGVMGDSSLFYNVPPETRQPWLDNTLELRGSVFHQEFVEIDTLSLQQVDIPVLLIKGDLSPPLFSLIIDELHRHLPKSEVYTLRNASHGLQSQNPEDFSRVVFDFLGGK